jgi:hypothetical protein
MSSPSDSSDLNGQIAWGSSLAVFLRKAMLICTQFLGGSLLAIAPPTTEKSFEGGPHPPILRVN